MALVDCPECGRQVSTLAVACPHCGFPLSREAVGSLAPGRMRGPSRWTDFGFWVIVVGLVVVIIMSIVLLRRVGGESESETTVPVTTSQASATTQAGVSTGWGSTTNGICLSGSCVW